MDNYCFLFINLFCLFIHLFFFVIYYFLYFFIFCSGVKHLFSQADYDVFNALDLMENSKFLEELKFGQGDGNLQYYLYNWRCPKMSPEKVSVIIYKVLQS